MTLSGRQNIGRLCYGKLYEFEMFLCAEDIARADESALSDALERASLKTLYDYRKLLRLSGRQPKVSSINKMPKNTSEIISEIIKAKEDWFESAKACAWEACGREKDILNDICEREIDEIQSLKKMLL